MTSFGSCPQVPCPPPPSDHTGTAHYWADPGGQVKAAHGGGWGVPTAPVGFWVSWGRPPALTLPQESFTSGRVSEPPRDLDRGRVLSLEHLQRTEAAVHPLTQGRVYLSVWLCLFYLFIFVSAFVCIYLSIYLSLYLSILYHYVCICSYIIYFFVLPEKRAEEALPLKRLTFDLEGLMGPSRYPQGWGLGLVQGRLC